MKNNISIIISAYNEEEGINFFGENLGKVLQEKKDTNFEVIWVNDGSKDKTQNLINQIASHNGYKNITNVVIEFSRNFGHEAAMISGIDNASGDAIICLDADGQHPPIEIPNMISSFLEGFEIVLMKRTQRQDNGFVKRTISSVFYNIINLLSTIKFQNDSSDFFLISRNVAEVLKSNYREKNRFIRGFIQSIGFSQTSLPFIAPARKHGESHYSYKHLFKLALDSIFTFSLKPLRISILFSFLFVLLTLALSAYSIYQFVYGSIPPSGYTTIILFLSFSFSSVFLIISLLSLYFEKVIEEMRNRPIYIIKNKHTFQ